MRDGRDAICRLAMRSVLTAGRLNGRVGRNVHALTSGLWLGLLSEPKLRELDELYYETDGTYRTVAWNERGLFDWESEAVRSHFVAGSRIVVIGAGGGREVLALLDAGFDAVGYESHAALCAFATELLAAHHHSGRVRLVPRDLFPEAESCDGVIVGWGAYSLVAPRERRVELLRAAADATRGGGPVMLSCFSRTDHGRDLELTAGLARRLAPLSRRRRRGRARQPMPAIALGDTLAPNRVHVFTRLELEDEIHEAGLAVADHSIVGVADAVTKYTRVIGRRQ